MVSSSFEGFGASCKFSIYINMYRKLIGAGSKYMDMCMILLSSVKRTDQFLCLPIGNDWQKPFEAKVFFEFVAFTFLAEAWLLNIPVCYQPWFNVLPGFTPLDVPLFTYPRMGHSHGCRWRSQQPHGPQGSARCLVTGSNVLQGGCWWLGQPWGTAGSLGAPMKAQVFVIL